MKVLLATDGSTYAEAAARFLARLPHVDRLDIDVLTVINVPHIHSTHLGDDWRPGFLGRETLAAEEVFDRIAAMFEGANARLRHTIREGNRGETIVDYAEQCGANLIVMGARGRSPISRILLGSTSDYVATHAPCSVLVIRPSASQADQHDRLRVALAYDDTGPSQAAIEEFSEFQWGQQTELHVISVVSYVSEFLNESLVDPLEVKQHADRMIQGAVEQLRAVAPGVECELIDCDHVGDGIVQFAERQACDLVVMGHTNRSVLGQWLLGSVSKYVLRHSPCSVWITRNRMIGSAAPALAGQETRDAQGP